MEHGNGTEQRSYLDYEQKFHLKFLDFERTWKHILCRIWVQKLLFSGCILTIIKSRITNLF